MSEEVEPNFEQALAQLERIVGSLERGEPELTAALSKYQKGVQLLSVCHRLLDQAEQSVAILTGVDPEGNALTAQFDATATMARETPARRRPAATPQPRSTVEHRSNRVPSESSVRRGRTTPVDETIGVDDPPF